MLPEYLYASLPELVSDRLKSLYLKDSLTLSQRQIEFKQSNVIKRSQSSQQYYYAEDNLKRLIRDSRAASKYMLYMQKTDDELGCQTSREQYYKLPILQFRCTQPLEQSAAERSARMRTYQTLRELADRQKDSQAKNDATHRLWHGGACEYRGALVLSHERARSRQQVHRAVSAPKAGKQAYPPALGALLNYYHAEDVRSCYVAESRGYARAGARY